MSKLIIKREDFVQELAPPYQVRAEDAFIDRLELTVGDWALYGSDDDVLAQLNRLRDAEIYDGDGEVIRLFRTFSTDRLSGKFDIRFASALNDDANTGKSPLIAGRLEKSGRYRPHRRLVGAGLQFGFACTLNLTRWVQAQQLKRYSRPDRPQILSDYVMAIAPDDSWYADERPLVQSTNLIIGPNRRYGYAKGHSLERHLANYIRAVSRLLTRSINDLPLDGQRAPERERYYSLREIEFYWEFEHDSPIQYVWNVIRPAISASSRSFVGGRDVDLPSAEVYAQSPNVKAQIAKATWLRVYAKTDQRVRFEIVLERGAIESCLGARSGNSLHSIAAMISPLRDVATNHLNAVLPHLNQTATMPSTATALRLLSEVQRACGNHHLAEAIVGALIVFGRVAPYNNDPMREAVNNLKEAGVLRPIRPRSRICVVTEEYRRPLEKLAEMS
ncbi:hypothetical protein GLS40_15165 [Pseudooceanicola sp. 216_PA32_1]|uniref:Uncharacterized protein n=1 Tax=Pseudooceanicola pacificus TaxID=2676438 RepID=A0A844WDT1_9RHOB|nr:hypothetical protein [Pseudooceanicola pacificus]MWB79378.1 hypothetical protein [Pseudooceanicola pacificus]